MKERRILIAAILIVTIFGVSVVPTVQNWWKRDSGVTAEAGVMDVVAPTAVTYDYANFDAEIKSHKVMTITLDNYGTIHKDRNYELGSAENPFIVLEIVPYEGYAEFGYLVAGYEPIDFDRPEIKYAGSITKAGEVAIRFNDIVTGSPVWAEEILGYAEYYGRPTADTNLDGEEYPAGYLAASELGTVFGKFVESSNGAYNIEGFVDGQNIRAEYVGSGGNYSFEVLQTPSYEYVEKMQEAYLEAYLEANPIIISRKLTTWHDVYGFCEGRYGRFVEDYSGDYCLEWPNGAAVPVVSKAASEGGGNRRFVEKEDPTVPYDGFYDDFFGEKFVPVYNSDGVPTGTAVIPGNAPVDYVTGRTYAYYDGKFGYFIKAWDGTGNIELEGTGTSCSQITVSKEFKDGSYKFIEESGVLSYFDGEAASAAISFMRDGTKQEESIQVSYAISSQDEIFASICYYRPKEYYYHNGQTDFMTKSLAVTDNEVKDYQVRVLTVTPQVLNELAQRKDWSLIDAADYISFNNINHVSSALSMWGKYYNTNFFSPSQEEIDQIAAGTFERRTFLENDISWAVAVRLLCKISIMQDEDFPNAPMAIPIGCYNLGGGDPYSVQIPSVRRFMDGVIAFTQGAGSINNVTKLYLMLELFETDEDAYFYNHYIKTGKVTEKETTLVFDGGSTKKVTTGYFDYIVQNETNRNGASPEDLDLAALYWGTYTFLDFENTSLDGNGSDNAPTEKLFEGSNVIWFYPSEFGSTIHTSVRNNVYTFNNGVDTTQDSGTETFKYADNLFQSEPFEIIEFCDRDALTVYDVMYYLLNQERSSLNVLINGSLSSKVYSNVDYEADNIEIALEVGQIINKKDASGNDRLYGRVQFNVELSTRKGDETDLSSALVQFNIYREDIFDDAATMELENLIPITEAYLLEELQKPESEREVTRLKLGLDYYYDVPLELLGGTVVDGKLKAATTEDVKFNAVVCYGLKDKEQGIGYTEEDYKFKKNISVYEFEQDENGKITEVKKDERKTLTFVRRAMFNLD